MVNNIYKIALVTEDVESAVQFYTETLDLEVVERFSNEDDEDFVFLKAGEITLELMPAKTMQAPPGFHHISFKVENVDNASNTLNSKAVEMTADPFDAGVGNIRLAFFNGPDNVNLQLFQREQ